MKHIMPQISYCVKSVISSFFCLSSCKFPNHLCHLLDMPKSNIPVWYCSKNITHIVLSHIHVPTYLASFPRGKPFQSQTTEIYPGLWPFSPTAHFGFHRNRCVPWEVNEMTGSGSCPSLPARCIVSDWSISRNTNQGNNTKPWHRRCVTARWLYCWGQHSLISWGPAAQSPGSESKNASYA